jgi:hypothetical protein
LIVTEVFKLLQDEVTNRNFNFLHPTHIPRYVLFFFVFKRWLDFMIDILGYTGADLANVILKWLTNNSLNELVVSQPLIFASHLKIDFGLDSRVVVSPLC